MKEIIILGDVEMGGGTLTDDFVSDKALSELILELANKPHPVDIVFNGDTFDLLKCPIIIEALNNEGQPIQKRAFPRHITEEISLQKLKLVHQAHKPVFGALGDYLKKSNKHVFFVLGNHDHDLMFKGVQKEIKNILCDKNRDIRNQVHFPGLKYRYGQVLAEHGHQYDFLNQVDIEHWYLIYKNKRILNIPWVSFGVVSKFMEMKEQHPLME
ncbi:MAG: metallophosphoesterase, partial [Nanoarchaeota archaeon]|nr:metallophosphoesterase [Nanoarchaeota archaeon]